MGLLSLRERRSVDASDLISRLTQDRIGGPGTSQAVGWDQALCHSAIWAGTFLYADLIATLPFHAYRDVDGTPTTVPDPVILTDPSDMLDPIEWRTALVVSLILRGNAWGVVTDVDGRGQPARIDLVHPDTVDATWVRDERTMLVRVDGRTVDPASVWHMSINNVPGSPFGLSMIGKARASIYGGLAAQDYGNGFFANGAAPTAILKASSELTADQAMELKAAWDRNVRAGSTAVLASGVDYETVQVSPEDTQFLGAMKASVQDVARFLRLPPEMIGGESGSSMTYSNVESRAVDLLRYSIDPVLVRVEKAYSALQPRPQYTKATRAALLRMTTMDAYRAADLRLRNGTMSQNEFRALFDEAPIDDGDEYVWPPGANQAMATDDGFADYLESLEG